MARFSFVFGIIALLCVGIVSPVPAEVPTAVVLLYFEGYGEDQAVRLEWATASEFNTAGFFLERADGQGGPFIRLEEIGFVPAKGDPLGGATYEEHDYNVVNGQTYWYILIELEYGGTENPEGPISVTAGEPTSTPTSTNTPTPQPTNGGPGNSTQPSSTPTASSTPSPTTQGTDPTQQAPLANTPNPTSTNGGQGSNASAQTPAATPQGQNNSLPAEATRQIIAQAPASTDTAPYPAEPSATFFPPPNAADGNDELNSPSNIPPSPYPFANEVKDVSATAQQNRQTSGMTTPVGSDPDARILTTNQGSGEETSNNTLILWIGFIAALLIFAVGIFGSIKAFSRRHNRES